MANLWTLLLVLINPLGETLGDIYTIPKLIILVIIIIVSKKFKPNRLDIYLWLIYLLICVSSSLFSLNPIESLIGSREQLDGLIYQFLIAAIALFKIQPNKQGVTSGLIILIIATVLGVSLYSFRGHQAVAIMLCCLYLKDYRLSLMGGICCFILKSRMSLLILLISHCERLTIPLVIGLILVLLITLGKTDHSILTGREYHYIESIKAIKRQPLTGYGFPGYAQSFMFNKHPHASYRAYLGNREYSIINRENKFITRKIPRTKAHNIIIDRWLDVGVMGMIVYLILLLKGKNSKLNFYILWLMLWYTSGQYDHLYWLFRNDYKSSTPNTKTFNF